VRRTLRRGAGGAGQARKAEYCGRGRAALQQAETTCRLSVEEHVRRVAAVMEPRQGARYLAMVLPRLAALDHSGPPNARLDH